MDNFVNVKKMIDKIIKRIDEEIAVKDGMASVCDLQTEGAEKIGYMSQCVGLKLAKAFLLREYLDYLKKDILGTLFEKGEETPKKE